MAQEPKRYCPACDESLPFEVEEGETYCGVCGRTPSAAIEAAKTLGIGNHGAGRVKRTLRSMLVGRWATLTGALAFVFAGLIFLPQLTVQSGLHAIGQVLGLALILGPIYLVRAIYKRITGR